MNSSNNMMVSVCMITYNHEKYIGQAIEGVLLQKCNFSLELIIGEDCSTDNTRKICEEYQRKNNIIKLLPSETNLGIIPNFIRTLNSCSGKYIAICEGDDYWIDSNKLQKQVNFLENNSNYTICFHNVQILNKNILIENFITRKINDTSDIYELAKGNYIQTSSCVFRKCWDKLPAWYYSCSIGDYPLHMINSKYGKIKYFPDIMATYRIHNSNCWANLSKELELFEIHSYLNPMIGNFDKKTNKILLKRFILVSLNLVQILLLKFNVKKAIQILLQLLKKLIYN
jgi:glycosyltransferase involved in cell wall biosynthesis